MPLGNVKLSAPDRFTVSPDRTSRYWPARVASFSAKLMPV